MSIPRSDIFLYHFVPSLFEWGLIVPEIIPIVIAENIIDSMGMTFA